MGKAHSVLATVVLSLLLATPTARGSEGMLTAAVSEGWGPPLVLAEMSDRGHEGLLPDLYRAIGARLGLPVRITNRPRKRVTADILSLDMHCYATERWFPADVVAALAWSEPVFTHVNLVIAPAELPAPAEIKDLRGTIATTLGYVYPALEAAFAEGTLVRSDAQRAPSVVDKVAAGHTDYGVVNSLVLRRHLEANPQLRDRVAVVREIDPLEIRCAARRDGPHAQAILAAVKELEGSGELRALRERWSGGGPS